MGRRRKYATAADRQRAYRERKQHPQPAVPASPSPRRRTLSRPRRLALVIEELLDLAAEYQDWRDRMPENLSSSALAEQLELAIDQLESLAADAEAVDLPRGFGRSGG